MFVTANGEVLARKIFRRLQNRIKCDSGKRKQRKIYRSSE